jgi:hypothetical protein
MKMHQKKMIFENETNSFGKSILGFRTFTRQVVDRLTIPADRWHLNRLAKRTSMGVEPLLPVLSRQESALPSSQNHDA